MLGLSAERAYSSVHSSLGKFRKSPQKKIAGKSHEDDMNRKETSLQSNPNQWLHIWFARGKKIIQIVDRFILQHFVHQNYLF